MEASFLNGSLDKASQLAGKIVPETNLLGHVEAGSQRHEKTPSPVLGRLQEEDKGIRKTRVSASVKETGYDSVNNYMVSCTCGQ